MASKRKLVIVGGGALGREAALYAKDMIDADADRVAFDRIAGFLDDAEEAADRLHSLGVAFDFVEPIESHQLRGDFDYLVAVGNAKQRRVLCERLGGKPSWATIVHPTAYVATNANLGQGCLIGPFSFVGANAVIQDHVVLNTYASVGHDSLVGEYGVLSPYAVINGNVTLGAEVFFGTHATVIPGLTVGARSSLSAGAVVVRDVPPDSFMIGNPAKGWRKPADGAGSI